VTTQQAVVEQYFDGFRKGDHALILACLTDDVVWDLPGWAHHEGKAAFDGEIGNPEFVGRPTLSVERVVSEGDTVVTIGNGEAARSSGGQFRFAYCDVFTFRGDKISRVESYVVPLT
jgi:ketosteroid isomerase-like protein